MRRFWRWVRIFGAFTLLAGFGGQMRHKSFNDLPAGIGARLLRCSICGYRLLTGILAPYGRLNNRWISWDK
jgi:hypothetical protein